jgi:hypothetical protein
LTYAVCFNSDFTEVVACSEAGATAFVSQVNVGQATVDTKGNSCGTSTVASSPEFPFPPSPADTFTQIVVGKTTSYNQATETGTSSFTVYNAGPGTDCNGSVFVNTANAPATGTGTEAFVASQFGNRLDAIIQTFYDEPLSDVDNLVGSGYSFRQ